MKFIQPPLSGFFEGPFFRIGQKKGSLMRKSLSGLASLQRWLYLEVLQVHTAMMIIAIIKLTTIKPFIDGTCYYRIRITILILFPVSDRS